MSHYDWESGSFKLSCKEYGRFKKALRDQWNASLIAAHKKAVEIQQALLKKFKGKRNVDWHKALDEYRITRYYDSWSGHAVTDRITDLDHGQLIWKALAVKGDDGKVQRPLKPKKKDFPLATNKTRGFSNTDWHEGTVYLDDKTRTVEWDVEENNHACDRASNSTLGRIFFELLNKVVWTRGTGGEIIGNDEYNRDVEDEYAGGGGSYVKRRFGPPVKEKRRRQRGHSRLNRFGTTGPEQLQARFVR
jgi:hypothetical protein